MSVLPPRECTNPGCKRRWDRAVEQAQHYRREAERLRAALAEIANDPDVSCLAGNPSKWPSTIAKMALVNQQLEE